MAYYNRGNSYQVQKKYDLAMQDFSKVVDLLPNFANGHFRKGLCNQKLGLLNEAIAFYDKAITLDKSLAEVYLRRGECKRALNKLEEAKVDFD